MTPTTHIKQLRDDIATSIRTHFPDTVVRTVDKHHGRVNADWIRRYATRAPAIVISEDGGRFERRSASIVRAHVRMMASVLSKKYAGDAREDLALVLVEHLSTIVTARKWSSSEAFQNPARAEVGNMTTDEIDGMGLALHVMAWDQVIDIPVVDDVNATLEDFARFWVEYSSLEPTTQPADTNATRQMITLEIDP